MLALFPFCLLLALASAQDDHGADYADEMGPVAFMWPEDRDWQAAHDNTPPCGSADTILKRTDFPLCTSFSYKTNTVNGQIALVAQDESWFVQVAVSYNNEPTTNDDFEVVIDAMRIFHLAEGHQCYRLPNPPANVEAGSNATIQIRYRSDFFTNQNETFFACADIVHVPISQFTVSVPCFNATSDDGDYIEAPQTTSTLILSTTPPTQPSSDSHSETNINDDMSGGAIAGIVIGAVAGVAMLLAAILFIWRRHQQAQRRSAYEASPRNVEWIDPAKVSNSGKAGATISMSDIRT